ncbi:type II toxin-antitoxin system YoeB family toxin [Aromatoleum anaerobium]|uniref:Uncharacterized protein n=1 Tax=Aromatoleum anaerobium TaxID=182180 RepID=A0ABX1PLJ9_9RHOO|nr:type II toxin-antitoxin system YoeB family toxin [Aromatoleum anaerobium]
MIPAATFEVTPKPTSAGNCPGRVNFNAAPRINHLIRAVRHAPFAGMGKREPCRRNLSGYWSRPVNDEQRLVCPVEMPTFSSPRAVPLMNSRRAAD